MATAVRRKDVVVDSQLSPLDTLQHSPQSFTFVQGVRLLMKVEGDVSFRASTSLRFPLGAIEKIEFRSGNIAMTTNFMGLMGPQGALPNTYTELMIHRGALKDTALQAFCDCFNHPLISLYYDAATKYRFYIQEDSALPEITATRYRQVLASLAGLGTGYLTRPMSVNALSLLGVAGVLAKKRRSASDLTQVLRHYFQESIELKLYQGEWLRLGRHDRLRLGHKKGTHNRLGQSSIIGGRVWQTQHRFCLRIGPVDYLSFLGWLPNGKKLKVLTEITQLVSGLGLQCHVQLVLKKKQVPPCGVGTKAGMRLGWNTWLLSKPSTVDADQVILPTHPHSL